MLKAVKEVFGRNISIKLSPAGGYNDVGYVIVIFFWLTILIHCPCSMPLAETVETYKYFITEAEKLDLAYITLVRYVRATDVTIDGQCLSDSYQRSINLVFIQRRITRNRARRSGNIPSICQECQTIP